MDSNVETQSVGGGGIDGGGESVSFIGGIAEDGGSVSLIGGMDGKGASGSLTCGIAESPPLSPAPKINGDNQIIGLNPHGGRYLSFGRYGSIGNDWQNAPFSYAFGCRMGMNSGPEPRLYMRSLATSPGPEAGVPETNNDEPDDGVGEEIISPDTDLGRYMANNSAWALDNEIGETRRVPDFCRYNDRKSILMNFASEMKIKLVDFYKTLVPGTIQIKITQLLIFCWDLYRFSRYGRTQVKAASLVNQVFHDNSPRNVAHMFTSEYKVFHNIRQVQHQMNEFRKTLREIKASTKQLDELSSNELNTPVRETASEVIEELKVQTRLLNDQLDMINMLTIRHNTLVRKLGAKTSPLSLETSEADTSSSPQRLVDETPDIFADLVEMTQPLEFESDETGLPHLDSGDTMAPRDGLYLLAPGEQVHEDLPEEAIVEEKELGEEVQINQTLLLAQLKNKLNPRRIEMKAREKKAYKEQYGRDPETDSDEDESFVVVAKSDSDQEKQRGTSSYNYDPPRFVPSPDLALSLADAFNESRAGEEEEFCG